jgi:hypothetical protein
MNFKILEAYKNHNYPYNLIFLSHDNILYFYSKNLHFETKFSLEGIHYLVNQNPNNFQVKNLYDDIYLMYSYEKLFLGRLYYSGLTHSYSFELINFENL